MNRAFVFAFTSLLVACGADTSSPTLSKEDARKLGGKADSADLCAEYGWYGDGICDDFCPIPDSADCGGGPAEGECRASGCSGQICADTDVISTCEFRPEYACYQTATCARQADGECGWTQTEALSECLGVTPTPLHDDVFFTYTPTQCGSNPWEADGVTESTDLSGELAKVEGWLNSQGVQVLELGFLNSVEPRAVCAACSCPRGDRLVIKANDQYAAGLINRGFEILTTGAHTAPKQCGSNPWGGLQSAPEADLVAQWAANQGVTLDEVGFLQKSEPFAVCAACSCPRGDTLFVIPAAGADASALGFETL